METKRLTRPLELKAVGDDGTFEGYGSVFNVIDSYRDVVLPGAFEKTIKEHNEAGTMPALLWQHRSDEPIGVYTSMEEDDHGLKLAGQLILDTQRGKEAHALLKAGAVRGLSIGFTVYKDGQKYNDEHGVWELSDINLWETSVVTFPANAEANVTDVRATLAPGCYPSQRAFEKSMRDLGFSRDDAVVIATEGFTALQRDAGAGSPGALQREAGAELAELVNRNILKLKN